MSLFRAPQVPQQPPQYFTPGQPLGIPTPRLDAQMVQFAAYSRPRVEIQQPRQPAPQPATVVFVVAPDLIGFAETRDEPPQQVPVFAPQTAPQAFVPAAITQIPVSTRWPIEWIVENYYAAEFTPGQLLGIPAPRQSDQTQAIRRSRIEIQQPQQFAPISPPQSYAPRTEYQMAAYFPPHSIAIEILSQELVTEFTPGQPLGIPQPKPYEQTAAYWRQRVEAIQPTSNPVYPAPAAAFVPAAVLPIPQNAAWRFEWLIEFLQPQFVPPLQQQSFVPPSSVPIAAYARDRREILQTIQNIVPPQLASFVPPIALQMPFAASQRNEWTILQQQRITAGIALGVPQPRHGDQSAAYFRQHFEIQQPVYFAPIPLFTPLTGVNRAREIEALENGRLIITFNGSRLTLSTNSRGRLIS